MVCAYNENALDGVLILSGNQRKNQHTFPIIHMYPVQSPRIVKQLQNSNFCGSNGS